MFMQGSLLYTRVYLKHFMYSVPSTEDAVDLSLVKTGLSSLLQKNPTHAMDGIFSQVRSE